MSEEVAVPEAPQVPDLYRPPVSAGLDASDIKLPKLKVAHYSTPQVQDGIDGLQAGDLFTHITKEDVTVLRKAKPKHGVEEPLEFYVLAVRKGWSLSVNNELQTWSDDDPNRDPDAWRTYTYSIAIPEFDEGLPYDFLITRSSMSSANLINLLLKKHEQNGAGHELAFHLRTKYRENDNGKWYVAAVTPAPAVENAAARKAREQAIEVAGNLSLLAAAAPAPRPAPAIDPASEPSI